MALDHALLVRLFVGALGLIAGAWALRMLASGRARDRWGPVTESDNPIRFALSVAGAMAVVLLGLLFAVGLIQPV